MKTTTYNSEDNLNLKLVIGLYRSQNALSRSTQRILNDYGLTLAQFGVMEALYHLGDMKINDLIEKTLSTSGNMTVVIRNLEKEDFVRRCRDEKDGRIFRIALTPKGQAVIEQAFPEHLRQLGGFFKRLTTQDKQMLSDLLKQLNGI